LNARAIVDGTCRLCHASYADVNIGTFEVNNKKVVYCCIRDQGPVDAATNTAILIMKYHPTVFLSAGIMGGLNSVVLNDVAVILRAQPLDKGRTSEKGLFTMSARDVSVSDFGTNDFILHFKHHHTDLTILDYNPSQYVLSGNSVREDLQTLKVTYNDPHCIGVDMETWGIFSVLDHLTQFLLPPVECLGVIKAVSDVGGDGNEAKRKVNRKEAARRAAVVAYELLCYRFK